MNRRKTTDAVEILHELFVRGKPAAERILIEERERLRVRIDLHEYTDQPEDRRDQEATDSNE